MATTNSTNSAPPGKTEQAAAIGVLLLDDLSTLQLAMLLDLVQNEAALFTEEQKNLAEKPGVSPDLIEAVGRRAEEAQQLLPVLAARFELSRTSFPKISADTVDIQGRVFNAATKIGIADATVVAISPQRKAMAKTVTDVRGAFQLSISTKVDTAVSLEVRSGRSTLYTDPKPAVLHPGQRVYRDIGVLTERKTSKPASS
jgi:hypothetical protein